MRLALFTDTLADVNGVSRFLQDMARCAARAGCTLRIFTASRRPLPAVGDVVNLPRRWAMAMPAYPELDLVWPDAVAAEHALNDFAPDAVHVSTPGPVGLLGRRLALRRKRRQGPASVLLAGTYHTDFPAYARDILGDQGLAGLAIVLARRFYAPFDRLLVRSTATARSLLASGVLAPPHSPPPAPARQPSDDDACPPSACSRLGLIAAGVDHSRFSPAFADPSIWKRLLPHAPAHEKRLLYVGRVSREKNTRLLAPIWRHLRTAGDGARLVIVGDGPAAGELRAALGEDGVSFLGPRFGAELAALYASADVLLFPSRTDTLGQVVLEAQASGLPAMVSTEGGPAGVIRDQRHPRPTGLALPAGGDADARHWAAAAAALLADEPRRAAMAAAAAEHMADRSIMASFQSLWSLHQRGLERLRQA